MPECITGVVLTAGCDEAGRGCLSGPVVAAAVILPEGYDDPGINDSKQLTSLARHQMASRIKENALAFGIGMADPEEIDRLNILQASIAAMHRALDQLAVTPGYVLVDGNRFKKYKEIPHTCIVKGDALVTSIAAASILAKHRRDLLMAELHQQYPQYGWDRNKGYPTKEHIDAIARFGKTPVHRKTFHIKGQLKLSL